jgi:hypothetical protein
MRFENEGKAQPAGTQFLGLVDSLIDLFKEPNISEVEVVFVSYKLDAKGNKIVEDNQHVAEIRWLGLNSIGEENREKLRGEYDKAPMLSLMVLWLRPSAERLGVANFPPIIPGQPLPQKGAYTQWEKTSIAAYMRRHNL